MPRVQLLLTVAAAAVVAAGGVVGITLATRDSPAKLHPQSDKPPVPGRLSTPASAAIRTAFASWPKGSLPTMLKLEAAYPRDPVVQYYVGFAYAWAGYDHEAIAPLKAAEKYGKDTPIEINAETLLNPQDAPVNPVFQPSESANALIREGVRLEGAGRRESAERVFARNARLHPNDPEALAAAAFGRFKKSDPSAAFSRLGPLAKRFPQSQSLHFNLGFLLSVIGQPQEAVAQFNRTVALGPKTLLGKQAQRFLNAIRQAQDSAGTTGAAK